MLCNSSIERVKCVHMPSDKRMLEIENKKKKNTLHTHVYTIISMLTGWNATPVGLVGEYILECLEKLIREYHSSRRKNSGIFRRTRQGLF